MKSREQILKEKPLTTRLHLTTTQFKDVEKEHIWALATAHSEGTDLEVRMNKKIYKLNY